MLSRRPCRDRGERTGSSHHKRCWVGIDSGSHAIGPNPARAPGRPRACVELRRLIIEMATSNPTWGCRPITGELVGLGHRVGASTVRRILKHHHIDPAPQRTSVTWTQFLRSQAAVACGFATVDTALLRRYCRLFFIDIVLRLTSRDRILVLSGCI